MSISIPVAGRPVERVEQRVYMLKEGAKRLIIAMGNKIFHLRKLAHNVWKLLGKKSTNLS